MEETRRKLVLQQLLLLQGDGSKKKDGSGEGAGKGATQGGKGNRSAALDGVANGGGVGDAGGGVGEGRNRSSVMLVGAAARRDSWRYQIGEVTWRSNAEYRRRQQQMAISHSIAEGSGDDNDNSEESMSESDGEGADDIGDEATGDAGEGLMVVVLQVLSPELAPLPSPPSSLAPSPSPNVHGYSSWIIERSFEALEAAAERWQVVFKEVCYQPQCVCLSLCSQQLCVYPCLHS
jgi:hypothetical protein